MLNPIYNILTREGAKILAVCFIFRLHPKTISLNRQAKNNFELETKTKNNERKQT